MEGAGVLDGADERAVELLVARPLGAAARVVEPPERAAERVRAGHVGVGEAELGASVFVLLMQLKLVWTTVFSRCFLGRTFSAQRVLALVIVACGCAGASAVPAAASSAGGGAAAAASAQRALAVAGLVFETALSGASAVYTQSMFGSDARLMWVRNVQLATLSIAYYGAWLYARPCDAVAAEAAAAPSFCSHSGESDGGATGGRNGPGET